MKLEYAIWNLNEASEHIESLITELKKGRSIRELNGYCLAWVQEIYWHLNRVWNARGVPQAKIDAESGELFDEWCRIPKDLDLG